MTLEPGDWVIRRKENDRGIVTFKVGRYEAIHDILKSWIPHIIILEPADLRDGLLKDVKEWVKKQEKQ